MNLNLKQNKGIMMDATYFPLLGMNYILNDTTQIVDLKMDGVNKVNILLCAQPNS